MVQSTDPRNRYDLPHVSRLNLTLFRSVFLESEVRSVSVVVGDIRSNHAAELRLIDRDDMIEAVFPQAGNPSFGISVLPRRSKSCAYLLESKPIDSIPELRPVDFIIVSNQETPRQIERTGFDNLLGGPLRSRMLSHVCRLKSPLPCRGSLIGWIGLRT